MCEELHRNALRLRGSVPLKLVPLGVVAVSRCRCVRQRLVSTRLRRLSVVQEQFGLLEVRVRSVVRCPQVHVIPFGTMDEDWVALAVGRGEWRPCCISLEWTVGMSLAKLTVNLSTTVHVFHCGACVCVCECVRAHTVTQCPLPQHCQKSHLHDSGR